MYRADLADLGIGVEVTVAPTTGEIQVSELWLEIEWQDSPEYYDPVGGVTPDAVLGDMAWNTTGTQVGAIVGNVLRITDASAVDWRAYDRTILVYGENYNTEVCCRCAVSSTHVGFVYCIATIDTGTDSLKLCALYGSPTDTKIGIATGTSDLDDESAYLVLADLNWKAWHHYHVVIDRDTDLSSSSNVRVYVDYEDTPTLEVRYTELLPYLGSQHIWFGSGDATYFNCPSRGRHRPF